MEKRTIIAFVLSFAVLLLWSYVFAPKEEQVPPKGEPPTREAPKEAAAPQQGRGCQTPTVWFTAARPLLMRL